jgi:hypothetical protein
LRQLVGMNYLSGGSSTYCRLWSLRLTLLRARRCDQRVDRRSDTHVGGRRPLRLKASDLIGRQRLAAVVADRPLPLLETRGARRRRCPYGRHPILKHRRRTDTALAARANDGLARRHDCWRKRSHRCIDQRSRVNVALIARQRLAGFETLLGGGGYCPGYPAIHIGDVIDRGVIHDCGVVDVIDDGRVDTGVGDIDVVQIPPTHGIRGHIYFAGAQCKPADGRARTNPSHQRWRVHRTHIGNIDPARRCRYPTPASSHGNPTTIVERRKSPGPRVDPGIAPWGHVRPMSDVIRRPPRLQSAWIPNVAVLGRVGPCALIIKVFTADHIARNIVRRLRSFPAIVARTAPRIEIVEVRGKGLLLFLRIVAGED